MKNKKIIYHILTLTDLKTNTKDNYYKPVDFDKDGFIHCTLEKSTCLLVLEDYFVDISNKNEILIMQIDAEKLKSEVKYEPPSPIQGGGTSHLKTSTLFPHIYGLLNIDAIIGVGKVERIDNKFIWPSKFTDIENFLNIKTN